MMRRIVVFRFFPLVLTLLACSSPPRVRYYLLRPPEGERSTTESRTGYLLSVGRFAIDPAYGGSRLVYQTSPYELAFYNYHQWASPPEEQVRRVLALHLERSGLFREVLLTPGAPRGEYLLTGEIRRLCEEDEGEHWYASLVLALQVVRTGDGKVIWSRVFRKRVPAENRSPVGIVRALSEALDQVAQELVDELGRTLADR